MNADEPIPEPQRTSADPFLDEVRAAKAAVAADCGHDLDRLLAHLRDVQRAHAGRVVTGAEPGPVPPARRVG